MESSLRRRFSIFSLVFILIGISGINISGAVPSKYGVPAAPTNLEAVGGLEKVTLSWIAPYTNGGKPITSYIITSYPGAIVHTCKSAATRCVVTLANPNKPSSKPSSVWMWFTATAVNSIGKGQVSIVYHARVQISFRATIYIAPKYGADLPTPTPTPKPTINAVPAPSPDSSPSSTFSDSTHPFVTNAFDGTYSGAVTVNVSVASAPATSSVINTSFVIYAGRGSGRASSWSVEGYITDAAGVATVTAENPMYGSFPFTVNFTQDPVTKAMNGVGKGVHTFNVTGYGSIVVEFSFNVSKPAP